MSHYSNDPAHCRVDLFKPSGKWYETVTIDMTDHYEAGSIHDAIRTCYSKVKSGVLEDGWSIVCLEPYHQHSHPIMIKG